MKKQSKRNQYIAELAFERDHFQTELKRVEEHNIKDFRPVWYLGDNFTKYAAQKRIRDIDSELNRIDSDMSYTPWKDDLDPRRNLSQDDINRIKKNLDEQEIDDLDPAGGHGLESHE